MPLTGFSQIGQAFDAGKYHYQYFYKAATPAPSGAGFFVDCGQSGGIPKYNAYAGGQLVATPLEGAGNAGIYPGNFISGNSKYLARWNARISGSNSVPSYIILADYVLFYPLVDCDDVDPQVMDNTISLPRYTDGAGLRPVLICTAPITFSAAMTITYTNQNGTSGRTTTFNILPSTNIGGVVSSSGTTSTSNNSTPFFPLAGNDTGIRSIQQVQLASGIGGFLTIALVRPIATLNLMEIDVPTEKVFGVETQALPKIEQGAYLNFILHSGASTTTAFLSGEMIFINA